MFYRTQALWLSRCMLLFLRIAPSYDSNQIPDRDRGGKGVGRRDAQDLGRVRGRQLPAPPGDPGRLRRAQLGDRPPPAGGGAGAQGWQSGARSARAAPEAEAVDSHRESLALEHVLARRRPPPAAVPADARLPRNVPGHSDRVRRVHGRCCHHQTHLRPSNTQIRYLSQFPYVQYSYGWNLIDRYGPWSVVDRAPWST